MRNFLGSPGENVFEGATNDNIEILKMWLGTTLAFAIATVGGSVFDRRFLQALLISAVVCGLAFVLHELAHRVVARAYGAEAHFVANNGMLLFSILLAFTGFLFAAPGAVWHRGMLTRRQGGLIALAGPATNMVLALLFLLALLAQVAIGHTMRGWFFELCYDGFRFNAWIGIFNMIPAGPFDGAKVLAWNVWVFAATVLVGVGLAFGLNDATLMQLFRFFA